MDENTFIFEQQEHQLVNPTNTPAPPQRAFKKIHKRVVCRYWLNNNCSKHDACEFLHEFNPDRMPDCRKGAACKDPSCFFQHPKKESKPLCPNYEAGFCSFGYSCGFRHEYKEALPDISEMFLASEPFKEWNYTRAKENSSFRSAECPYYKTDGWCPYFLACAFSHGPPVRKQMLKNRNSK
jgi:hypothetical protein